MPSEVLNPIGEETTTEVESEVENGRKNKKVLSFHADSEQIRESKASTSSSYDNNDEDSVSIADQVIKVKKSIQDVIRTQYNKFTMPKMLVPFRDVIDDFFECTRAGSSVEIEFFAGILHFFSCMYILAVIPFQVSTAGFNSQDSAAIISLLTGIASIACGIITNLPLIIAPTTAISIYYVSNIRQYKLSTHDGNMAVTFSGIIIILIGVIGPLGRLMSKLIPGYIQYGVTIGIGLITVLSGLSEIDLVVQGKYTLLAVGPITNEVVIAISALILIAIGVFYHSKVSYLIGLFFGTVLYWSVFNTWPVLWANIPTLSVDSLTGITNPDAILLVFEIFILNILSIFGLAKAMCDLADLTPTDESIPRGRKLLVVIGIANCIAGIFNAPPILISPESSSGIKGGSKTGLSAVVGGCLFILSVFFAPLFSAIPAAGTTPVLIMIGLLLFQNVTRIDFTTKYGMPAFMTLILIPFCDSILVGLIFGYITYVTIAILTGDFQKETHKFIEYYFPAYEQLDTVSVKDIEIGDCHANNNQLSSTVHYYVVPSDKDSEHISPTMTTGSGTGGGSARMPTVAGRRPLPSSIHAARARGESSPAAVQQSNTVTRARRASMAFINSVMTEGDLKTDFSSVMLRYDQK